MLHTNLNIPHQPRRAHRPIIQKPDLASRNNLLQSPIQRIPHLYKPTSLVHKHEVHPTPQHRLPGLPHKFHDHGARDVTHLINIYADFLETEQEFGFIEAEHAQGPLIPQSQGDASAVWGFEVGDAEGNFLVQRNDLDTPSRGDRDTGVEEVDGVGLGRDIELVEVAEVIRGALA